MENLLEIIAENTSENRGISVVKLASLAGISISAAKNTLNELHRAGKIRVREGINDKLIFLL